MDAQLQVSGIEGVPATVVPPTCPFFRSVAVDGAMRPPVETPDGANRCAAYPPPRPQSALQQELVCLTSDHTDCPRYAQGIQRLREVEARRERFRRVTRPTSMAVGFLLVSAVASLGFVVTRGGLPMPSGTVAALQRAASPAAVAAVSSPVTEPTPAGDPSQGTVVPTPAATTAATPEPPPVAAATPSATPDPTPRPTPRPTPAPTPAPTQAATATPAQQFAGLEPCPGQSGCWVYIVRSGDSLWAIGQRFGHSLDTIYEWNEWTRTRGLRPGAEILLPPPSA